MRNDRQQARRATKSRFQSLGLLAKPLMLRPSDVRYSYVYAVAVNSSGQLDRAITVLENAHRIRPADRQVLFGLITFERDKGNLSSAATL